MPVGTSNRDLLIGTPEADLLEAFSENDTVLGLDGDDMAYGRDDDDWISGNSGRDFLSGNQGSDFIYGGKNNDTLIGGDESSSFGNRDDDFLSGNFGDDILAGGYERDTLFGNQNDDILYGNLDTDILYGGKGNDILYGGKGNDFLYGNLGNDYLAGEGGVDTVEGGSGTDLFVVGKTTLSDATTETNPDLILDFRRREDFIQLADSLRFDDLTFIAGTGDRTGSTILQNRHTGENLAILVGIRPADLDRGDFLDDPSLPAMPPTSNPSGDSPEAGDSPTTSDEPPSDDNPTPTPPPPTPDPDDDPTDGNSNGNSGGDSDLGNDDGGSTDPDGDPTETNQPPTFTSTADTQATQGTEYTYNIVAADPDIGDNLTITAVTLPDWLTLTDNGNGRATLTGTPDGGDLGTPEIVLRVSDSQNLEVEQRFMLTVVGVNNTLSYADTMQSVVADLNAGTGLTLKYEVSKNNPLKIMPLGDSITQGKMNNSIPEAEREGYRRYLWNKLIDFGLEIDFVGSQSNGSNLLLDRDHEGHPGENIAFIRGEINNWINATTPDIILLKIGTNNTDNDFDDDGQQIADQLDLLVKRINQNANFTGELLVSSIPPIRTTLVATQNRNRHIDADSYNDKIQGVVNQNAANDNVAFVDMRGGLTENDITPTPNDNGLHPTDGGYQTIAQFWYDAILQNIRVDNDPDDNLQNIDNVTGSAFSDILIGHAGVNILNGRGGDDKLTGGGSADNLTGGGGIDTFVYKNPNDGLDTITDFGADDIFQVSVSGFGGGLVAGTPLQMVAAQTGVFVSGNDPGYLGAVAHFLYDTATGILSFDADGSGGGAEVELAQLAGMPVLGANQVAIVV